MLELRNPNREAFDEAIGLLGQGVISTEWKESAWNACQTWIAGHVMSSPYGKPSTSLHVNWTWKNGDLTVSVMR